MYWKAKELQKKLLHDSSVSISSDDAASSSSLPASSSSSSEFTCPNPHHPFSLTSDLWTGPDRESYICLTLHFLDDDWVFRTLLLDIYLCTDRHLAQNLYEWIKQILLDNDLFVCVYR